MVGSMDKYVIIPENKNWREKICCSPSSLKSDNKRDTSKGVAGFSRFIGKIGSDNGNRIVNFF